MRKLYSLLAAVLAIIFLLGLSLLYINQKNTPKVSKGHLIIYNWGDYIDPALLTKFTKETGIQVDYETFDSNESMYTKIKQGGTSYDIIVPSDYMINKLIKSNLLTKLDKKKLSYLDNIDPSFLNLPFDPHNEYSVPYFWGTLGIVYNDRYVKTPPSDWGDLWQSQYHHSILMIDGAREVMGIGLNTLGYSLNTHNKRELSQARQKLDQLTPNVKAWIADEIKTAMITNEAKIAVTYSGEARTMVEKNKHLHYLIPSSGGNIWFDNLAIPKNSKHKKEAYAFINFMLKPENAKANALYVGYSTPNEKAKALLPDKIKNNPNFYPSNQVISHLQVYQNLGSSLLNRYNDLYLQVKMYKK